MQVEWYGQSAFRLPTAHDGLHRPLRRPVPPAERGMRWDYPAIQGVRPTSCSSPTSTSTTTASAPSPAIRRRCRSTAGRLESPIGEVLAIASEHDAAAGTERGPNTLFAFTLGGRRVAHLGDLGQADLREEQARALGSVDLLFVPSERSDDRRRAGRRDRRPPERPRRGADALPHRAHRLPRARRRLCALASASSASSRARSTSTPSRAATDRSSSCPRHPSRRSAALQRSAAGPTPHAPRLRTGGRGHRRSIPLTNLERHSASPRRPRTSRRA